MNEKIKKDPKSKIWLFIFLIGCYAFLMGLNVAGVIQHPNDAYYLIMVSVWLLMIIVTVLFMRKELIKITSSSQIAS